MTTKNTKTTKSENTESRVFTADDLKTLKSLPMKYIRAELGKSERGNRNIIYNGVTAFDGKNNPTETCPCAAESLPAELAKTIAAELRKSPDNLHARTYPKKPDENGNKRLGVWIARISDNKKQLQLILDGLNKSAA